MSESLHIRLTGSPGERYLEPVNDASEAVYLETGIRAYTEHYRHLWPDGNPHPYISRNLTPEILQAERIMPGFRHGLVCVNPDAAGILALRTDLDFPGFHPSRALMIDKLYLRNRYTGSGLGSAVMDGIRGFARRENRTGLWLKAMKRGKALDFYTRQGFVILGETTVPYPEILPAESPMWILGQDL